MSDDDDLLFSNDNIERWKGRELPPEWLKERKGILFARCQTQSAELRNLIAIAEADLASLLDEPL